MRHAEHHRAEVGRRREFILFKSDYLSEGAELVGQWQREGAEWLGLRGTVDKEDFDRLCDNIDPRTGESLTKITRDRRESVTILRLVPQNLSASSTLWPATQRFSTLSATPFATWRRVTNLHALI